MRILVKTRHGFHDKVDCINVTTTIENYLRRAQQAGISGGITASLTTRLTPACYDVRNIGARPVLMREKIINFKGK